LRAQLRVADDAHDFADACVTLLVDNQAWDGMSRDLAAAAASYAPSRVAAALGKVLVRRAAASA
jgi:hypothetical protein